MLQSAAEPSGAARTRCGSPAALAAVALAALALCCVAPPARAAEKATRPVADAAVTITASPSSVQVDATSDAAKDQGERDATSARRYSRFRFDSDEDFDAAVEKMPWVIALIFLVVGSIFLTPLILLVGIIWYKLRKTRLQNEAMLALAEKGVVPTEKAAEALATGAPPAAAAPQVYQQAVAIRKRVVWSDLRKGILITMVGAAWTLYSILEEGIPPNWLGLVLLFVGLGYLALWWFEGKQLESAGAAGRDGGAKPGGN
jgi:Domain of unknown function (DUF6249)